MITPPLMMTMASGKPQRPLNWGVVSETCRPINPNAKTMISPKRDNVMAVAESYQGTISLRWLLG